MSASRQARSARLSPTLALTCLLVGCSEFNTAPLDATSVDAASRDLPDAPDVPPAIDLPQTSDRDVIDASTRQDEGVPDAPSMADLGAVGPDIIDVGLTGPDVVDVGFTGPDVVDADLAGPDIVDVGFTGLDVIDGGTSLPDVQPDLVAPQDRPDVVDSGCPAGTSRCAGACVNPRTDANHCGACGVQCTSGQGCVDGTCQIVCGAGTRNCSGVCRDISSDEFNCGGCDVRCGALQRCAAGRCTDRCPAGSVLMTASTFLMGTAETLTGPARDQNPQHSVTLSDYCLGLREVTVEQYRACVNAGRCSAPAVTDGRCNWPHSGRDRHPINCVTHAQATAVCNHLYPGGRLPTEAEWENAAGWSGSRPYPWGPAEPTNQLCWSGAPNPPQATTCEVGQLSAGNTPNGISDLAGNVWEWVSDLYGPYSSASVTNPAGPATGSEHVVRGGGFTTTTRTDVAARVRGHDAPSVAAYFTGVRCAATP